MQDAMEASQVALVLFSEEFFERPATKGELKVLSVPLWRNYQHVVLPFVITSCPSSSVLGDLVRHCCSSRQQLPALPCSI